MRSTRDARSPASPQGWQPYVGEVMLWAGYFAPSGWAFCNGQLLSIAENETLFYVIGTTYGGDGQTTFALPDLRGCVPVHSGQGPGLSPRVLGENSGVEAASLGDVHMAAHTHPVQVAGAVGSSPAAAGTIHGRDAAGALHYGGAFDSQLAPQAVGTVGGNQAHGNLQPYLALNYCISLFGIFPTPN